MKELLCPAGDFSSLKAAVHNGADAIYISGRNFGARKYAKNFTNEELKEAVSYAHVYGVFVYVTINTVIYEDEVSRFLEYVKFLYLIGVDAVIVQDIGMVHLIRRLFPDLLVHISTQGNNCNDYALKYYKNLGVNRVVLARELSLDEINSLKTSIDKEVFIHGALCICYSGCCLFSSLNGSRSGNRGMCAGPCRLPYSLIKNGKVLKTRGKYLLSPKELNSSSLFSEVFNSNIQSFKIEGRMKSPSYVAFITRMYRNLIDKNCLNNDNYKNLKKLFNRDFTLGHLFNKCGDDLMNCKSPNHIGFRVGRVLKYDRRIKIKLNDELCQNDGIRFLKSGKGMIVNKLYNADGLLINKATSGDIVYVDNKVNLNDFDDVSITSDYNLMKSLEEYDYKRIPVCFTVKARLNERLSISISDGINEICLRGNVLSLAINRCTSRDEVFSKLGRLGNTPFVIDDVLFDMDDNVFIPLKEINSLRRDLCEALIDKRTLVNRKFHSVSMPEFSIKSDDGVISAYVTNETQLKHLIGKIDMIYTDDILLYQKYKNSNVYYRLDRTSYSLPSFNNENLVVGDIGSFYKYSKNNNCVGDYFLNINNSYSANYLLDEGLNGVTLSPELSLVQMENIAKNSCNLKVVVYGSLELMVMKHCIIKTHDNCPSCKDNEYYLLNQKNEKFRIVTKGCKNHIIHCEKIDLTNYISRLRCAGINSFHLEFMDDSVDDIDLILNKIKGSN